MLCRSLKSKNVDLSIRRSLLLTKEPSWFAAFSPRARKIPLPVRDWLSESSSLTARLRAVAGSIRVQVLYQGWGRPFPSEAKELKFSPRRWVWLREVELEAQGKRLLFARTVVPEATLKGSGTRFSRLGARPLGEVLFNLPKVRRVKMEWTGLDFTLWLPAGEVPRWGRRALYLVGPELPLLVSEFFLPKVFALEEGSDMG